jgi:serine/threonine protein kinase
MLTESDKHVAEMAVSRYGADRTRVLATVQAVQNALARGQPADLLDALVEQNLLTAAQANRLRFAPDHTHLDPALVQVSTPVSPPPPQANGAPLRDVEDLVLSPAGPELRTLGEYRILATLGEGGMGAVYRGYNEGKDLHVAIKVLSEHLARNQAYVDRFHREVKSVASLDHPNIVRSIAAGRDPATGKHYLVLEYVDGENAQSLLERFGRLPVGDAVHIIRDIARALEHAHSRNIVHRDIKPDNILLTKSGVAKLADLGLAKRTDEVSHLTATRQGFGTPYYMPYEQALDAKRADARSDIYALGGTLYHLVTGEVPFSGTSHLEIVEKKEEGRFVPAGRVNEEVPPELDRILARMLAPDPDDRYQTASELIVDLERSNLAARVPSFVEPDQALQDPLVRARLASPAQPTQPDLGTPGMDPLGRDDAPDLWYLRYRDREGRWRKVRLTAQDIVERLRKGRLAASVEACQHRQREFRPLAEYPVFRAALARKQPRRPGVKRGKPRPASTVPPVTETVRPPARRRWRWLLALGIGLVLALIVFLFILAR